ncbi:MAG TPA: endonuclease domain-containing protein [Humisphaera sp.]
MDFRAFRVDPRLLELARELRTDQSPAEQKLWRFIRNRRLANLKFRRQFAVDRYIADFYCAEYKLIVELDGPSHFDVQKKKDDAERTACLEELGYAVVRFRNADVHENLEGVIKALLRECEGRASLRSAPHPRPLP